MTRLSPEETCDRCGSLLFPPQLASETKVPATAAYVCLKCGRAYAWAGTPPRLTVLGPVAISSDDDN